MTKKELIEQNQKLRFDNLMMRLEFEVLIDGTESRAAKKILAKYRLKRAIRNESELATKN